MKNQYFGDINDYRKYGLLRSFQSIGTHRLLVAWMLTPDDAGRDGRFREYLGDQRWRHHDPDLYAQLVEFSRTSSRDIGVMDQAQLLPRTTYFAELVPDSRSDRLAWRANLLRAAENMDLVFLDPDTGIEVPSKPIGSRMSSKYAAWDEIEKLWEQGCSVLVYQHYRHEKRDQFEARMLERLRDQTRAPGVGAFRTPRVVFLHAIQQRHDSWFKEAAALVIARWKQQIEPAPFDPA